MKATSLFGGVQAFNILISITRSKVIAILLGPAGIGVVGLLTSAVDLINSFASFGLSTSAVKDVAAAHSTNDLHRSGVVVTVFRRWVWITGLFATLLMIASSPWLSKLTFGNSEYTSAFAWISVTLLFNQLTNSQLVVLQGMRHLNYLARANVYGNVLSLFTTLPLYYFFGIDGVVPALILSSAASLTIAHFFAGKVKIQRVKVSKLRTVLEGRGMLKLGFFLSISGLVTTLVSYIVRIFISNQGGVEDVGLYNSGFQIINTYVGMIFAAMATDYYPRLSGVAHDNKQAASIINQQGEIALLIMAPIILFFLVFVDWIVIFLYSKKFVEITPMIQWAAVGMLFKAASWAIAFMFLAKGDSKLFFFSELVTNIYLLGFNLIGYQLGGLTGLGVSFLLTYVVYLLQVYLLARARYQFNFEFHFYKLFGIQLILAISCFLAVKVLEQPYSYMVGLCLIVVSVVHAYQELNKRLGLMAILENIRNRFFKK
nr:O-antigen translocase [Cesiribacter sp. SM1]